MVVGAGFEPANRLPEQIYSLRALAACISHRSVDWRGGGKGRDRSLPSENCPPAGKFSVERGRVAGTAGRTYPHAMHSEATKAVLEAEGLGKSYGTSRILQGMNLRLEEGERVAVMGPSGSGKSTLLTCLAGLEEPDEGEVRFLGRSLRRMGADAVSELRRGRITSIFQFFHLLPTLTAEENVAFPLMLAGTGVKEKEARTAALLEEVGLAERRGADPSDLSGGELQRLAIARALITEPALLLADEPTGSLDASNSERILGLLRELTERHGTALLMVTHDPEAAGSCDRILHIRDGRLSGDPVSASA